MCSKVVLSKGDFSFREMCSSWLLTNLMKVLLNSKGPLTPQQ